jgi:hypothetical protein
VRSYTETVAGVSGIQIDSWSIIFLMSVASAAIGLFVASLAYRGYVRNDSTPMLCLTIGIALLTIVPFLVSYGIDWLLPVEGTVIVLLVTMCRLLGLFAIIQTFRRS